MEMALKLNSKIAIDIAEQQSEGINKKLKLDDINPHLVVMPPVHGFLGNRAFEIEEEIKCGVPKPFKKVIRATVGCCHSGGQKPVTFVRQLLAAITCPSLLENGNFLNDVKEKATLFLKSLPGGSIGSYSPICGLPLVRQLAAKYIENRDGIESNWKNIYLTNGASGAIFNLINLLKDDRQDKKVGVLIPIPKYPLYSNIINGLGMESIGYYLNEEKEWSINVQELQEKIDTLKCECIIKAIVVINPGNPVGQVLTKQNIEEVARFSNKNGLMIIADEVYQSNIHNKNMKFHSFKKVIHDLNLFPNNITLASLMSASKGYLGECGLRGGYVELENMDADVQNTFEKSLGMRLSSSTYGQAALYCLFSSPKAGESSYELFEKEVTEIKRDLKIKAKMAQKVFNSMEGFSCTRIDGSLYAFAKVTFPPAVLKAAYKRNQEPDYMYSQELLETKGVFLFPGSQFEQKPGTYHIRMTLLLQIKVLKELLQILKDFHTEFLSRCNKETQ